MASKGYKYPPLPEIINGTKQKLVKGKIKKYINECY